MTDFKKKRNLKKRKRDISDQSCTSVPSHYDNFLKNKDLLLSSFLENSSDAIFLLDSDGKILSLNLGAEEMYGYSGLEILNKNFKELVPDSFHDVALDFIDQFKEGNTLVPFESKRISKEGTEFSVSIGVTPVMDKEKALQLFSIFERDISPIKSREEKYAALLESAPIPKLIIDEMGMIHLANSKLEKLFGYSRIELVGKKIEFLFHEKLWESGLLQCAGNRISAIGLCKDGEKIPIEMFTSRVPTADGLLISLSIIDVSERLKKETSLVSAKTEAEFANQAKSDFLTNMSHEIRTPLAAIVGFTDLLIRTTSEEFSGKDYLKSIYESGIHLRKLVDDILDLAKIETGKIEVINTEFQFVREIKNLFSLFNSQAMAKGISFEARFSENIPQVIKSDSQKIYQILTNVIGNAIKFTNTGSVEVDVNLVSSVNQENEDVIEFLVKDTGCGIDLNSQRDLFQPFTQGQSRNTQKYGGTGLGLNISMKLAHSLGGDVVLVESRENKGSVFLISFTPELIVKNTKVGLISSAFEAQNELDKIENLKNRFSSSSVLVVEDEFSHRMMLKEYLTSLGIKVDFATNGFEAVEKVYSNKYDLIFMDIQMLGMDGCEATKKIRDENIKTPIIALTARMMRGEQIECLEAGCEDIIGKPYNYEEIVGALDKFLF